MTGKRCNCEKIQADNSYPRRWITFDGILHSLYCELIPACKLAGELCYNYDDREAKAIRDSNGIYHNPTCPNGPTPAIAKLSDVCNCAAYKFKPGEASYNVKGKPHVLNCPTIPPCKHPGGHCGIYRMREDVGLVVCKNTETDKDGLVHYTDCLYYIMSNKGMPDKPGRMIVPILPDNFTVPPYYGGPNNPQECVEYILAHNLDFFAGNVVKYITRAGKKDGETKLQAYNKALHYLQRIIARETTNTSGIERDATNATK